MSNQLVPLTGGAVPAAFASLGNVPDMAGAAQAGLQASFAVIGFRGKNWRLKYRGEEILVKDSVTGAPVPTLDVVIVGVSPAISKQWYDKKFTDGDDAAPDCFSVNGVHPDASSPKKQCESCAVCPQNIWGSRITEAGKKAKACQDSRRVAVVPLADIANADFGGPMMLRLPPTSLNGFAAFNKELARFGAQPFMVATQLGFDYELAYPLITFKVMRWLNDEEAPQSIEAFQDPSIERMLAGAVEEVTHDPAVETSALAQSAPPAAMAAAVQQPAVIVTPAPTPAPTAAPAPAAAVTKKTSPFAQTAAPAPTAVTQVVQATTTATPVATPAAVPTVVQQAPTDMEAAIDALLAG
jgi:hypothetical protein